MNRTHTTTPAPAWLRRAAAIAPALAGGFGLLMLAADYPDAARFVASKIVGAAFVAAAIAAARIMNRAGLFSSSAKERRAEL